LAELYQIETRMLKQAVRRNLKRFPADFMFGITDIEIDIMVSQNVISSKQTLGINRMSAISGSERDFALTGETTKL